MRKNQLMIAVALAIGAGFPAHADNILQGRSILPADTFAAGPTSGAYINGGANGRSAPFVNKQPVQGFSALLKNPDGTFFAMSDNGFGSMENSADYHLRVYHIQPDFKTVRGGTGQLQVKGFFELSDPDHKIPFAITRHFSAERILTGADFDIESMQRAPDGTFWFGEEFGPFLLHTDASGKLLEAPIALPDFDNLGHDLRSPQNPYSEESSAVRVMNAVRAHADMQGANTKVVFSPWHVMLDDNNAETVVDSRKQPPAGSGLAPASSEIFNMKSIHAAGFPVVTWTVNDKPRMQELMKLGVNGIISDRPDLLLEAVREYDANGDGVAGDFLTAEGLIDITRIDAQGHRGGRGLRPENTLPAMEVALDNLMTTLETDNGVSADGMPMLDHDPHIQASKCRRADGSPYVQADEVLVKDLTQAQIQSQFVCDQLLPGRPEQKNDPTLSPATLAFAASTGLPHAYAMPSSQQLFDFVAFYADYYKSGSGSSHPDAEKRWKNAERVRFNIETKVNPRAEFASRTIDHAAFTARVAGVIAANDMQARADIQSFDFRTLLDVHKTYPQIRTVFLFGDFPIYDDPALSGSDDGTNLQDENGRNTPWLGGLYWPYRVTKDSVPFRVEKSGGFEGMAMSPNGKSLYPLLERPLAGEDAKTLLIHEFDLTHSAYTGTRFKYRLDERASNIGDFILYNGKEGMVIERDNSQGDLNGFKKIFKIGFSGNGQYVEKSELVDLLRIKDPHGISEPVQTGEVGTGYNFAFPFVTIEDVVVLDRNTIGVINDNNYPFSVGRHTGTKQPDDTEFITIRLDHPLKLDQPLRKADRKQYRQTEREQRKRFYR